MLIAVKEDQPSVEKASIEVRITPHCRKHNGNFFYLVEEQMFY